MRFELQKYVFPTPDTLKEANLQYGQHCSGRDQDGIPKPYPISHVKDDVFQVQDYETLDKHALQVKNMHSRNSVV